MYLQNHVDIDECADDIDSCASDANCTNTDGSFLCTCNQGYEGDGNSCEGNMIPATNQFIFVECCNCHMLYCSLLYTHYRYFSKAAIFAN